MSKAFCRTCGGEVPNHYPSLLDPKGVGHPFHSVQATDTSKGIPQPSENPTPAQASSPQPNKSEDELAQLLAPHLNEVKAGHDSKIVEKLQRYLSQRITEARIDELKSLAIAWPTLSKPQQAILNRIATLKGSHNEN